MRSSKKFGARVIILVDNQSLLHALQKGRSSRQGFNKICRPVAALAIATNLHFEMYDMKSKLILADEPSRTVLAGEWEDRC